jgi:dTDP-4-amino-4,6-dideoxygalactose transaminase
MKDLIRIIYPIDRIITTTSEEVESKKPNCYGRKMPGVLAVLGVNQLKKIDNFNQIRFRNAKYWDNWCEKNNYKKPLVLNDSIPVFLRYPILVEPEKKSDLSWALKEMRVKPGIWYVSNIHPSKQKVENCPNADLAVKQCVNMPTLLN